MSISGVSSTTYSNSVSVATAKKNSNEHKTIQETVEDSAVVYEKSDEAANKTYVRDEATIQRLKSDIERRTQSLRELVERMLLKQGKAFTDATEMYAALRNGEIEVDPEVSEQAQKDIADDGYWGVKQTSDRLVSFAIALAGGDPSKADLMIDAVKKGFEEAERIWGGELPEICKKTYDEVMKKLEAWRDGVSEEQE